MHFDTKMLCLRGQRRTAPLSTVWGRCCAFSRAAGSFYVRVLDLLWGCGAHVGQQPAFQEAIPLFQTAVKGGRPPTAPAGPRPPEGREGHPPPLGACAPGPTRCSLGAKHS